MTDITGAARGEVHDRHPVWRDDGVGIPAGVLLVALAIRYEQRIKNFTSVAMKIAALR